MTTCIEELFEMSYPRRMGELQRLGTRYIKLYEELEFLYEAQAYHEREIEKSASEIVRLEKEWVTSVGQSAD